MVWCSITQTQCSIPPWRPGRLDQKGILPRNLALSDPEAPEKTWSRTGSDSGYPALVMERLKNSSFLKRCLGQGAFSCIAHMHSMIYTIYVHMYVYIYISCILCTYIWMYVYIYIYMCMPRFNAIQQIY